MKLSKKFTGYEYLLIDLANHAGYDKDSFEKRIDISKEFLKSTFSNSLSKLTPEQINKTLLESDFYQEVEDKAQFFACLLAIRSFELKEPSGYAISLDAVCSGIQIMSALSGCKEGLALTGALGTKRGNAYKAVYDSYSEITNSSTDVTPKELKKAVMTAMYGSKAQPLAIFGEENISSFEEACHKTIPGAYAIKQLWNQCWNPNEKFHNLVMVDGFNAVIPNLASNTYSFKSDKYPIEFNFQLKEPSLIQHRVSNIANSTHACDAFIAREMIRRCNYSSKRIRKFLKAAYRIIKNNLVSKELNVSQLDRSVKFFDLLNLYAENGTCSINLINYWDGSDYQLSFINYSILNKLIDICETMLTHKPFEIYAIHDNFKCLPNYGNIVRYWYKEILADLCESNVLESITNQLSPVKLTLNNDASYRKEVASLIRKSTYAIC